MRGEPAVDLLERRIESAVGGAYRMDDGRNFWIDGPVAQEVARRAADGVAAYVRDQLSESAAAVEQLTRDLLSRDREEREAWKRYLDRLAFETGEDL